jgi:hypothetical protein
MRVFGIVRPILNGTSSIDDGPTTWYDELEDYQNEVSEQARLFGFEVLDYITDRVDQDFKTDGLPFDSFYPTGIGPQGATDDPEEIYRPFAEAVAEAAGYELLSWMGTLSKDDIRSLYRDENENIAMPLGDADVGTDPDDAEEEDLLDIARDTLDKFGDSNLESEAAQEAIAQKILEGIREESETVSGENYFSSHEN